MSTTLFTTITWSVRCFNRAGVHLADIECGTEQSARFTSNPAEARRITALPVATTQLIRTTHTEQVIA